MTFDGDTITPADFPRLNRQLRAVYDLMRDGQWRSLRVIAQETGAPESSISARLRDLRKPKFGRFKVLRQNAGRGYFLYKVMEKSEPCYFFESGAADAKRVGVAA